jgi:hypothetical protein
MRSETENPIHSIHDRPVSNGDARPRLQWQDFESYVVQSSVPVEVFEAFVGSLKRQTKISVTQGNAVSVWFLAKEFLLSEVAAKCGTFSVPIDQFSRLFERVSSLEWQISFFSNPTRKIEEELGQLRSDLKQRQATSKPSASPSPPPKAPNSPTSVPSPTPSAAKSDNEIEIPMKEAKSLDGIILYLTKKHGGNVQEKGIVTTTSKSVYSDKPSDAPKNVADLTSDSYFLSKNEPGQWVCWDFRERRVRPTHYTIRGWDLKSWVVEGSLDGRSWTEIDRQTDNQDFKDGNTVSFAVSNPAEFRFIRLTQTCKNHLGDDYLALHGVEFFGTLSE